MIEVLSKRRLSTASSVGGVELVNERIVFFNLVNYFVQFYIVRLFKAGCYAVFSWMESYFPALYYVLYGEKFFSLVRDYKRNKSRTMIVKWLFGFRNIFSTVCFAVISLFLSINSYNLKKSGSKVVTFKYLQVIYYKVAEYFPDILFLIYYLSIASVFLASFKILYDHKKTDLVLTLERKHGISIGNSYFSKMGSFSPNASDFFTQVKREINYNGFVDMEDFILIDNMKQTRGLQFQIHLKRHILRNFQIPLFIVKDMEFIRVPYDYYRSFKYMNDVYSESSGYTASMEVLLTSVIFLSINILLVMIAGSLFGISQTDYTNCLAGQCNSNKTAACDYEYCSSTNGCTYSCDSSCQHMACSTFSRNMLVYTGLILYNVYHGFGNTATLLNTGGCVVTTLMDENKDDSGVRGRCYTDHDIDVLNNMKKKCFFRVLSKLLDDDELLVTALCRVHYGSYSFVDVVGIQLDKLIQMLNTVATEKGVNYQLYYNSGGHSSLKLLYASTSVPGLVDFRCVYSDNGYFDVVSGKVDGCEDAVVDYLPYIV